MNPWIHWKQFFLYWNYRESIWSEPLVKTDLRNYNTEATLRESNKGQTVIYISSDINCKVKNDLRIYIAKELEPILIKIININKVTVS